ncbi:G-protein coupled receptor Mth2-like isoform X3 [Aedes albopictus]|uniref:G-protein coupled receptors family 2 profile 2 domain-containing protein n=1 Tax=Aedes albopictus TaxID=7160 RepID=A0ABM1ZTB7_AEDAL
MVFHDRSFSKIFVLILIPTLMCFGESVPQLPCEFLHSVNISGGRLDDSGGILYNGVYYKDINYATVDYSYDDDGRKIPVPVHTRGCVCQVVPCVWLCCLAEFVSYDGDYPTCSAFNDTDQLIVEMINGTDGTEQVDLYQKDDIFKAIWKESCATYDAKPHEWNMNESGYVHSLSSLTISQTEYCLIPSEDHSLSTLYFCSTPSHKKAYTAVEVGLILSIPFLLATLLIYAWIPELRNIHGKSLICYIFALTNAYIVLLIMHFGSNAIPCEAQGYLLYFFVLVAFFWLNVMCFDIFWTFSSGVVIKNERKRFLYYSLYAWGCPLVLVVLVAIFENTELIDDHLRPGFGINNCSFYTDKMVQFLYLYLPLLILIAANLYFFIVTAVRIIRVQRATGAALKNDSRRHNRFENDRHRFTLYLRLFIVMGVTWTFEIISWAMENSIWIFYVVDVCNCLLGVMIFFLFVWKQKVRKLVAKRIGRHRGFSRTKTTSVNTGSTMSGTRFTSAPDSTVPMNSLPA